MFLARRHHILLLAMTASGLIAAAYSAYRFGGAITGSALFRAGYLLLLPLAAVWGWFAYFRLRRRCEAMARQIRQTAKAGRLSASLMPASYQEPLSAAVYELLESSGKFIAESQLRAKELEIQLRVATAERQHAEAILYSISDAVLVTDPFDDVVLANESAARTFDFDLETSHHAPIEQVLLSDPKIVELIRETRQAGSAAGSRRVVEHQVRTVAGTRMFKVTLSSVADDRADEVVKEPGATGAGVVVVLHDTTHEKEVSQMKNDFVSNVSHELRTPLASIKAYVELLIDGEADDERTKREFYDVIQTEANRLGRLIDNILNISRIESGLVKIEKQPQSLAVIVKDAIEVIAPQAAVKGVAISERLTPLFYQTQADRDMLYQAVLNLLSNAVKYTPEGGAITVETTIDAAQNKVVTKISDTGVGIPPKDLPYVFDKFYRSGANNKVAQGTGLGLTLVKHIIETVHHGRMVVDSQVGKGSTFGFELDLCE